MAITRHDRGNGRERVTTDACGLCGEPIGHQESLAHHLLRACPGTDRPSGALAECWCDACGWTAVFDYDAIPETSTLEVSAKRRVAGHLRGECDPAWTGYRVWPVVAKRADRHGGEGDD